MANVTLWGASYSDVPSISVPKTGGGTASFTDVTDTTATASDVATGKYFYTAAGMKTEGTSSGGGGGSMSIVDTLDPGGGTIRTINGDVSYTRTQICSAQTISPNGNRTATLTGMTDGFDAGDYYIVTFDNTEYLVTCALLWTVDYVIGDCNFFFGTLNDYVVPFGIAWESGTNSTIAVNDTSQHTVKIEHLVLDVGGVTHTTKTITANGTYNAEDDDADGYTSVTVSVSTPSPNLQAKTNISPTTSSQTITADNGYDGLSSVQINSMPSGTAGTPTATKGTVSNHSVSVTPSVTNSTGYITGSTKTGTAVTVSASELVSGSQTITSNNTYDVTNLASVTVNVSGGSSKAIYTYKGLASRTANSYGSTNATVTVTKAGTYTISYVAIRGSSSGTMGTNLHIGATSGTNQQTWNNGTYGQYVTLTNQTISANTAVTIYATSGSNSRTIYVGQLIVQEE